MDMKNSNRLLFVAVVFLALSISCILLEQPHIALLFFGLFLYYANSDATMDEVQNWLALERKKRGKKRP